MKYRKIRNGFTLFVMLLISIAGSSLVAGEKQYNTKPYEFIASKLLDRKIVMLGESGTPGHNHLYSPIVVINIIKQWNEQLLKEHLKNKTLTLVIEKNPGTVNRINEYIKSGDMSKLMEMDYRGSLENCYLYYHWRLLSSELAKYGNHLEIAGFENDEVYNENFRFRKTPEEFDYIFGRERDTLIFTKLSKYISTNPKKNILIYYGNAHLSERYEQKTDSNSLYNGWGYFLGHYMRQEYSNRFVTVEQANGLYDYGDKFSYLKDAAFIMEKSDSVFANKVPFYCFNTDYSIIRHEEYVPPHYFRRIFSRNIFMLQYNLLTMYDSLDRKYSRDIDSQDGRRKPRNTETIFNSLKLMTGKDFEAIADYKQYLDSTKDVFYHDYISSKEFSMAVYSQANDSMNIYEKAMKYYEFHVIGRTAEEFKEQWDRLWNEALPQLNYFDYVGLYWFGTPIEKTRAKTFLKDYTHADFTEPADYLEWYYKNIYHYKFE
jgi:hypothetical protein